MTREDLKKYRGNKLWIEEQIELYTEMKQRAEGLKAVVLDGMPKQKIKDKIEEIGKEENLYAKTNIIKVLQELLQESEDK